MKLQRLLSIGLLGLLTGCVNPYAQYYHDNAAHLTPDMQQRLLPPSAKPEILAVSPADAKVQARRLLETGFTVVGYADFTGGNPNRNNLTAQAKKVGADVVLYASQYSHTERGVKAVPQVRTRPDFHNYFVRFCNCERLRWTLQPLRQRDLFGLCNDHDPRHGSHRLCSL